MDVNEHLRTAEERPGLMCAHKPTNITYFNAVVQSMLEIFGHLDT